MKRIAVAALVALDAASGKAPEAKAGFLPVMTMCVEANKKGVAKLDFPDGTSITIPLQAMRDTDSKSMKQDGWDITRERGEDGKEMLQFKRGHEAIGVIIDGTKCTPVTS